MRAVGDRPQILNLGQITKKIVELALSLLSKLSDHTNLLDIMMVQFRNEKVSHHGSIPIPIDCNVVAFIVFEEGFHQPIKRTKQSVFLDVTVFRHTLVD
ncbi:hypothetical protein TNCV_2067891 [Trichonephila clavipes]|uniref:Uncharacterized protein n=1 Tax=Trichonephila clavipes TaxID=2585209 RepID=A0A8X7BD84_TRICX|nr:hypothetical protein TNCV_2067891 [Trichonephila clavipes]